MNCVNKIELYGLTTLLAAAAVLGFSVDQVFALTISPPKIEINGSPGDVTNQIIKLYNEENRENVFFAEIQNFKARGELGEPGFAQSAGKDDFSLANWIEISAEPIKLSAGERKEIPFKIVIPENADPGGHYAGVLFSTTPPEQETGATAIGISGKLGSLILLRVAGEVQESGKLLEFNTEGGIRFFSSKPVQFYARFENRGNVHLKPQGEIKIKGIFDITSASNSLEVNETGGNVLPDSVRRFETVWGKKSDIQIAKESGFLSELKNEWENFALGKYQADLVLLYGTEGQQVKEKLEFWVVPWRIMTCFAIVLIIVLIILKFGIKRYNRWVIKKAGKQKNTKTLEQ